MLVFYNASRLPFMLEVIVFFGLCCFQFTQWPLLLYQCSIFLFFYMPQSLPFGLFLVRLYGTYLDNQDMNTLACYRLIHLGISLVWLDQLGPDAFLFVYYVACSVLTLIELLFNRVKCPGAYLSLCVVLAYAILGLFLSIDLVILFLHAFHVYSLAFVWRKKKINTIIVVTSDNKDVEVAPAYNQNHSYVKMVVWGVLLILTYLSVALWKLTNYTTSYASTCELCERVLIDSRIYITPDLYLTTPDAGLHYASLWTRDYAYMLDYGPNHLVTNVSDVLPYLLDGSEDMPPERLVVANPPIPIVHTYYVPYSIDNVFFSMQILLHGSNAEWLLYYPRWRKSFIKLVKDDTDGLLINSEMDPVGQYGFMDIVRLTGKPLFVNALMYDTLSRVVYLHPECADKDEYVALLDKLSISLAKFQKTDTVWYFACIECTSNSRVIDVWGTMYMSYLRLNTEESRHEIENRLPNLIKQGGLAHTLEEPWEQCWDGECSPMGTYQNGGYWSVPLAWTVPFIKNKSLIAWIKTEVKISMQRGMFPEWMSEDGNLLANTGYAASCSNVYRMVC